MNACCDIWGVFDEKNNLIKDYRHWKLLVRNRNTTLGNCVAITKRHIENFSEITTEEMSEFALVVKDVEHALRKAFQYDKMNYMMLMMKDKHTHFHILPRYASKREFAGLEWLDEDWPRSSHNIKENLSPEVLNKVKNRIKQNI